MKPGVKYLKRIESEWHLRQEAKRYLYFLAKKFRPAVDHVNKRNGAFQIIPGLCVADIYSESDFYADQFSIITIDQLDKKVKNLAKEVDNLCPFSYFIEISSVIALLSEEIYPLYGTTGEIEEFVFDPSERIFIVFGSLYLKKIQQLIDELIDYDFTNYFHFLFETKSTTGVSLWLQTKCNEFADHETRSIFLFKLVNRFRDEYLDHKAFPDKNDTFEFVDPSICYEKEIQPDGSINFNYTARDEASCSIVFQSVLKIVNNYLSKITVNGFRNRLASELKNLYQKRLGNIEGFIENHFHFIGQKWTPITEMGDLPVFMSTKLAFILNCYKEDGLLEVRSKEYLIQWLAFNFYGWEGYTSHTIRRPFYNRSGRRAEKRIRKKILERLEFEYTGLFTDPIILHFLN